MINKYDFIFSLGMACSCTTTIRTLGLQDASYPFDWLYGATLEQRVDFLCNNFKDFINLEDLEQIGTREKPMPCRIVRNNRTGMVFNHDFSLDREIDEYYPEVKAKFDRRIKRLYEKITAANNVLAVYIEVPTQKKNKEEDILRQFIKLRSSFENKISILYLSFEAELKNADTNTIQLTDGLYLVKSNYKDYKKDAEPYAINYDLTKRIILKNTKFVFKEEKKLVSVIIPAYNHENYIQDTIKSIINQTYQDIELLIIDDGSKDKTYEKILEMQEDCKKRFKRFEVIKQENKGTTQTINSLILKSNGEFIYLIASDDIAKPNAIEEEFKFLSKHKNYALCVGDNEFIDQFGNNTSWNSANCTLQTKKEYKTFAKLLEDEAGFKLTSKRFSKYKEFYRTNFVPNGYLIRKSIFEKTGLFTREAPLEDWYLMLQISKYSNLKFLNKVLFSYRLHPTNTAKQREKIDLMAIKTKEYENKLLPTIKLNDVKKDTRKFLRKILGQDNDNFLGRLKFKKRVKLFFYCQMLAFAQIPILDLLLRKKTRNKLFDKINKYWR